MRSPLADTDGIGNLFGEIPLEDRVDLGGPEAHAAGVQHAVGASEEGQILRGRVVDAEVAVRPDVFVAREVGRVVFRARRTGGFFVPPEEHGHVGERGRGYEFAGGSVGNGFSGTWGEKRVVELDVDAQGWTLRAADVDWG